MIGIVIVTYKNFDQTVKFVNEELCKIVQPYNAVIIDNSSTIEQGELLSNACRGQCISNTDCPEIKEDTNIFIIPTSKNLGYAKGNNLGAKFLINNFKCKYLLFSNDDILITSNDVVAKLIHCLENDKFVAAVGPRVVGTDKCDQSPHYRIISPYRQIAWSLLPFLRRKKTTVIKNEKPNSGYCYWVSGAFFMICADDFLSIEGFDSDTFLYGEEVIMAERLKRIDKREYFCADTEVVHLGGSSTKSINDEKLKQILVESNCLYYSRYMGYSKAAIWFYRLII